MAARIVVSAEMLAFVGRGSVSPGDWPDRPVGLGFDVATATFTIFPAPAVDDLDDVDLALIVAVEACERIFGLGVSPAAATWHLSGEMRGIALAIVGCDLPPPARETLRLAKSIELLCATFARLADASLVPADGSGELSQGEAQRIAAARRLIDERWHEKLTLATISRACGINRAKLTRGFRSMFDMTVADAIADRRLGGARELLLVTDLPVSSIAYRCGYLNNASFTRAFSRRFGASPTQLRGARLAA